MVMVAVLWSLVLPVTVVVAAVGVVIEGTASMMLVVMLVMVAPIDYSLDQW